MKIIAINPFVRRQTKDSDFSYFDGTDEELIRITLENLGLAKPGYRDGVIVVPVPADNFYSAITILKDGDTLVGKYESRQPREDPRIEIRKVGEKVPAKAVDIILYSHDTLEEDGDSSSDARWEIISINAFPDFVLDVPIAPMTLIHNHMGSDGGTKTNMSAKEFETALRKSLQYWQNKALVTKFVNS